MIALCQYVSYKTVKRNSITDCGENEERGCVSSCNKKCQNRKVKRVCPNCLDGCVCKPGYIEDTLSGMCVGDKYCPLPGKYI